MAIVLGVIADDFTGATDVASVLAAQGMRVVQVNGLPEPGAAAVEGDAVVVALKTRTVPADEAVAQSLQALAWLQGLGAEQFMFKYCSTFDSTPAGNIGPVMDALSEALDAPIAIVCPAFPDNGRRIYRGHLFVGDQLLEDSPMKDHPLTPMRQSSLVRLLAEQSQRKVGMIPLETVRQGADALRAELDRLQRDGVAYSVADATDNDDLRRWAEAVADHHLITG
ncbi:MAG: four-carbon acid sugar kinase family protein, partial [Hyphomicrobiales bacterium]